ncbi:uncharacterized protein [Rutidosis leptorrhynchoides]|uniref:uncharacterized protein isoform X2 n=1 Tax=Rutidosis leptorrhynchoides TaxID=125765 RepID=UPI003A9A12B7
MFDLNARIRVFQQSLDSATFEAFGSDKVSQDEDTEMGNAREVEEAIRDLEAKLAQIISETNKMELEFQSEQNFHMQEQKVLDDLKHRISLMESVMEGSKELQELAMQTSRLEEACSSLGEKLQQKCICPSCQHDNVEMLGGIIQTSS